MTSGLNPATTILKNNKIDNAVGCDVSDDNTSMELPDVNSTKTRRLSPELAAVAHENIASSITGSLASRISETGYIPKRIDLIEIMEKSKYDLQITEKEIQEVTQSSYFDTVKYSGFYASQSKSDVFYDFLQIYRWGGDVLAEAIEFNHVYSFDVKHDTKIMELLQSEWRKDQPIDKDELGLLYAIVSNYITWDDISVAEFFHVISTNRDAIFSAYKNRIDNHKHKMGFVESAIILTNEVRKVAKSDTCLEWLLTAELGNWVENNYEQNTASIIEVSRDFTPAQAKPYFSQNIYDYEWIKTGVLYNIRDCEILRALHE